jgi:hypothetical protein
MLGQVYDSTEARRGRGASYRASSPRRDPCMLRRESAERGRALACTGDQHAPKLRDDGATQGADSAKASTLDKEDARTMLGRANQPVEWDLGTTH